MSMELMVKAMRVRVGNPLRKLVLIKLADNANDLGECWPSHQHIADQCEISRRSVINHINALEEMGFLRREYRTKNNEKQSNLYFLTLDPKKTEEIGSAGDSLPSAGDSLGGAGDSLGGSAGDAHRTSHSSEPVNEPNTPISPKPKLAPKQKTKFDPKAELVSRGVSEQAAQDFLEVRKAKRAPLTLTAIKLLQTEAEKAGVSVNEAVTIAAANGWQSFQARYIQNSFNKPQNGRAQGDGLENMQHGTWQIPKDMQERMPEHLREKFEAMQKRGGNQ